MKEFRKILEMARAPGNEGLDRVLATVVNVEDSSYRRIGARMLILENGSWMGGISGGCLEGDALLQAKKVMLSGKPQVVTYDTRQRDSYQIGVGLGCEGRIDVLLQKLDAADPVLDRLEACLRLREAGTLLTPIRSALPHDDRIGRSFFASEEPDHPLLAVLAEDLRRVAATRRSEVVVASPEDGELEILLEHVRPNLRVVVCGDNYDVYPLLAICAELGWELTLVGKKRKLRKEGLEAVGRILEPAELPLLEPDPYTAVLAMSHDYEADKRVLQYCLTHQPGYFGLLGPRKRFQRLIDELNLSEAQVDRVHNPVGLHLGAATPEEIAVAIVAEIVKHFRGGDGRSLKLKQGAIHRRGAE